MSNRNIVEESEILKTSPEKSKSILDGFFSMSTPITAPAGDHQNMNISPHSKDQEDLPGPLAPRQTGTAPKMFTFDIVGSASSNQSIEARDNIEDERGTVEIVNSSRETNPTLWDNLFKSLAYDPSTQACLHLPEARIRGCNNNSNHEIKTEVLMDRSMSTSFETKLSNDIMMETILEETEEDTSTIDGQKTSGKLQRLTNAVVDLTLTDKSWWNIPVAPSDELEMR